MDILLIDYVLSTLPGIMSLSSLQRFEWKTIYVAVVSSPRGVEKEIEIVDFVSRGHWVIGVIVVIDPLD